MIDLNACLLDDMRMNFVLHGDPEAAEEVLVRIPAAKGITSPCLIRRCWTEGKKIG